MSRKGSNTNNFFRVGIILTFFFVMGALVVFKISLSEKSFFDDEGLSGVVSVKGTVRAADLNLSKGEVSKINKAVASYRETFSKVDLFLDVKDGSRDVNSDTVLVWAMVLQANGDCEVRSWSRKTARGDLVPQMVLYMNKAAKEYEEFKRFPDVKQNFKCLYI
jgi:hypothetical protein